MMGDMELNEDLTKLKVADLKRELKTRCLSTTGNKQELVDRLQAALNSGDLALNIDSTSSKLSESFEDGSEVEEDTDADVSSVVLPDDLDEENLLSAVSEQPTSTNNGTISLKRKSEIPEVSSSSESTPPKKISLSRHSIITFENTEKENTTLNKEESESNDKETPQSAINTDRKVIKLSGMSVQERLELRAKKFNVDLPSSAKLQARAERFGTTTPTSGSNGTISSINTKSNVDPEVLKKRAERFGTTPVESDISKISISSSEIEQKKKERAERFGLNVKTTPIVATSTATVATDEALKRRQERFKIVI